MTAAYIEQLATQLVTKALADPDLAANLRVRTCPHPDPVRLCEPSRDLRSRAWDRCIDAGLWKPIYVPECVFLRESVPDNRPAPEPKPCPHDQEASNRAILDEHGESLREDRKNGHSYSKLSKKYGLHPSAIRRFLGGSGDQAPDRHPH